MPARIRQAFDRADRLASAERGQHHRNGEGQVVICDMGAALGVALLGIQVLVIPALYFALGDDGLPSGRSRHLKP